MPGSVGRQASARRRVRRPTGRRTEPTPRSRSYRPTMRGVLSTPTTFDPHVRATAVLPSGPAASWRAGAARKAIALRPWTQTCSGRPSGGWLRRSRDVPRAPATPVARIDDRRGRGRRARPRTPSPWGLSRVRGARAAAERHERGDREVTSVRRRRPELIGVLPWSNAPLGRRTAPRAILRERAGDVTRFRRLPARHRPRRLVPHRLQIAPHPGRHRSHRSSWRRRRSRSPRRPGSTLQDRRTRGGRQETRCTRRRRARGGRGPRSRGSGPERIGSGYFSFAFALPRALRATLSPSPLAPHRRIGDDLPTPRAGRRPRSVLRTPCLRSC